jgi:dihydrofolate reductase
MTTILYLDLSADGLIATPNRVSDEEWEWSGVPWERWCSYCNESNNLIVGRKTYIELTESDVSDVLYPDHKIVISSHDLDLADTWLHFSNPKQAVDYLKSRDVENIIVGGGRQLGLTFVEEGLIDEIVLDIYPILFGNGTQLLGGLDRCIQLELVNSEKLGDGAIRVHYELLQK